MAIDSLNANDNIKIDAELKGLVAMATPYMFRLVEPYVTANKNIFLNRDVDLLRQSFDIALLKHNWSDYWRMLANLRDIFCTILDVDNAYRTFFRDALKEYLVLCKQEGIEI